MRTKRRRDSGKRLVLIKVYLSFEPAVFMKETYCRFRSVLATKIVDFLKGQMETKSFPVC
jgi:hypothetical protein